MIFTKNHASSDYADDAYYQLGETYMERQSLDTALVYYQQLIKTFPGKSAYLNQARLKSGLIYYNKSDNAKALAEYKTVMKSIRLHWKGHRFIGHRRNLCR